MPVMLESVSRSFVRVARLGLGAVLIAGCGSEGPAEAPPPVASEPDEKVVLEYDPEPADAVEALMDRWSRESPDQPVDVVGSGSTTIVLNAESGVSEADVYIVSVQTPLPEGDAAPISVRPWIRDPLVLIVGEGEERETDEVFMGEDRVAIVIEATPQGQYTRFGLRMLERWDAVSSRLIRHPDARGVLESVRSGEAALGVVYASELAARPAGLAERGELESSESSRRSYVVVAATADGVELARWLTSEASLGVAAEHGFRRARAADRGREINGGDPEE